MRFVGHTARRSLARHEGDEIMIRMALASALLVVSPAFARPLLGPSPYLSFADSPFNGLAFDYFHLEDFEDGLLNTPGVTPNAPGALVTSPGALTDSVDGDDGLIDGSGSAGRSLLSTTSNFMEFDFAPLISMGGLPTHVGIVWTDVGATGSGNPGLGDVLFEAYDDNGMLLEPGVTALLGDGLITGGTAEDRFFGAFSPTGILRFRISMLDSIDWEVDHLQYGRIPAPSAASLALFSVVPTLRRRRP